jgi:nucleoid-associated protein YgaU
MENTFLKKLLKRVKLNEVNISTFLGVIVVLIVGAIVFNFFRQRQPAPITQISEIPAESEITETPTPAQTVYTVQANDSLWKISQKYYQDGFQWVKIARENNLARPGFLTVGQKLTIPTPATQETTVSPAKTIEGNTYTVVNGDNLWQIALRAYGDGYQWVKIAKANNLHNPNLIHPGNEFQLPR